MDSPIKNLSKVYRILKKDGIALIFDFRRDHRKIFYGFFTFATKVVGQKALNHVYEPLGSIQSGYTHAEIKLLFNKNLNVHIKILRGCL